MARKILGGWSVDGVYTYQSGSDFSISTGTDYAGVGAGGGAQYWVVNGPLRVTDQYSQGGTAADPNFYFQPTTASGGPEFSPPTSGTINPQRVRDMFYGPGAWYINSALFKDFRVSERMKATLRWEPSQLGRSQHHADVGGVRQNHFQVGQSRPADSLTILLLTALPLYRGMPFHPVDAAGAQGGNVRRRRMAVLNWMAIPCEARRTRMCSSRLRRPFCGSHTRI